MDWLEVLSGIVRRHWATTGKALLLARVPELMARENIRMADVLQGRRLKNAILETDGTAPRIVRDPASPLAWGLIPTNVELPADPRELFQEAEGTKSRRFARAVWLAFSRPLGDGMVRFLDLGPPPRSRDLAEGDAKPAEGIQIDRGSIYDQTLLLIDENNRDAEIERLITSWAEAKGIPLEKLTQQRWPQDGAAASSKRLTADFSELSSSEMSRILIPLDLIQKIKWD